MSQYWGIHSEKDGQPVMRGWATSKADADAKLTRLQTEDEVKEDRYFVTALSEMDVHQMKRHGLIPDGV